MKENIQKTINALKVYYKNYNALIKERMENEALKQLSYCRGMAEVLSRIGGVVVKETFIDNKTSAYDYVWGWENATPMKSILFIEGDSVIEDYKIV